MFLYFELGILGLIVSLLPLVFVRYSYLSKHRLEQANRDLLKVLVKAIETRDPYTSGHSMRVMGLAETIGEELGLNGRDIDVVRTAALLHDVGKIDVVYDQILKKPTGLTEGERKTMESHVTRGVEILTSLSSFDPAVVTAVRHHHESFDGSGYPDELRAMAIPMAARIIKVCDAVDAMLSDRPYRPALTTAAVREQLERYAGVQFDPDVVAATLSTDLVEQHERYITAATELHDDQRNLWIAPSASTGRVSGQGERSQFA